MTPENTKSFEDCKAGISQKWAALLADAEHLSAQLEMSPCSALSWTEEIPHSASPGVFLLFDENRELLYIGKAERPMGEEVWDKLKRVEGDVVLWAEGEHEPEDQPVFVATIPLPDDKRYFAPSLEGLLIRELDPRYNTIGRRRETNGR